ncbi:MAG: glycosyl hydrolase family 8, partial [Leptolyngbyaceae cyanobacterium]
MTPALLSLLSLLVIGCGDQDEVTVVADNPNTVTLPTTSSPTPIDPTPTDPAPVDPTPANPVPMNPMPIAEPITPAATLDLLQDSWQVYRDRFIQDDGRVIDREAQDRTVSEGQAYAMLRAVMVNDPVTFEATLNWAEGNLLRQDATGAKVDHLWAWKWGQQWDGSWGILDENFASDADLDAVTALIFAAQRWNRPDYLELAQVKLADLWNLSTIDIPNAATEEGHQRYLLPGPIAAFQQDNFTYLNPSYYAPYAFRLFAQVDPTRDWMALVDTSYLSLEQSASVSAAGLPSDWVALDNTTGTYQVVSPPPPLNSVYSFDAFRVWWRIALDYLMFQAPEAKEYLTTYLPDLESRWRSRQAIAAVIDSNGNATVDYEATSQYAMLYSAFQIVDPAIADELLTQKLLTTYSNGIWDNDTAYYTQNLAWFGLASTDELLPFWLLDTDIS